MSAKHKIKENVDDIFEALEHQRDELRVKIHLAGMEVRDQWDELEDLWEQLIAKKDQLERELEPTAADARVAWLMLKDEIVEGYRTIRDRL
jgi:uncharacterized protein YaaN involved in tellurite resistance